MCLCFLLYCINVQIGWGYVWKFSNFRTGTAINYIRPLLVLSTATITSPLREVVPETQPLQQSSICLVRDILVKDTDDPNEQFTTYLTKNSIEQPTKPVQMVKLLLPIHEGLETLVLLLCIHHRPLFMFVAQPMIPFFECSWLVLE